MINDVRVIITDDMCDPKVRRAVKTNHHFTKTKTKKYTIFTTKINRNVLTKNKKTKKRTKSLCCIVPLEQVPKKKQVQNVSASTD